MELASYIEFQTRMEEISKLDANTYNSIRSFFGSILYDEDPPLEALERKFKEIEELESSAMGLYQQLLVSCRFFPPFSN
jgi:hypothetical protein